MSKTFVQVPVKEDKKILVNKTEISNIRDEVIGVICYKNGTEQRTTLLYEDLVKLIEED